MSLNTTSRRARQTLSSAIALALIPAFAAAQESAPEQAATTLDTLVVSGTAKFKGLRKRDASFSITTATPEVIQETAPISTADLLKIVPGVWSEASGGGGGGANIFVRGMPSEGDAPFFTLQLDGAPIFPPPTLSFLENAGLFRIDDTIARVEGLRGGPSTVYSNGQPGVTVNFIQKKGDDIPDGSVRLSVGSDAMRRVDVYSGGPLQPGSSWYYSVGGFFRATDGVRNTGFTAEKGGQLSATISKRWDENDITLYARHTDDKNVFYTGVPLLSRNNGKHLSSYPGIDATTGTLIGPDFRRVTLPTGIGNQTMTRDLADGRGVEINVFGGSLDFTLGRWTISDRFNYLQGDAPTNGLFTGANPQTLSAFITDNYGVGGSGSFVNGGGAVDPDQQVLTAGWWVVDKELRSLTNDLRFSIDITPDNALTIGTYYADYASKDTWWLGNNMLLSAENHARRINLALDDGRIATRDGFVGTANFNLRGDYKGKNLAFFIADEWTLNERIRLDAGIRYEQQDIKGTVWDAASVDLDNDPNTLYDNATSVATTPRRIDQDDNDLSWTAGLNYTLNDAASLFARINSGVAFPQFDSLRDGVTHTTDVDQYEFGLKAGGQSYELYLTGFYNDFTGLRYGVITASGENIVLIGDSTARGLEFEGVWRPQQAEGFELSWNNTWLRARYGNFGAYSGNQVVRQPKFRGRLTPSYSWFLPWGDMKVFATYTHVGDRFEGAANEQLLPAYDTWDLGVSAHVGEHLEFTFSGRNLSDKIALTEGNARVIGGATSGENVFMGRPLEGRSWLFSAAYRW